MDIRLSDSEIRVMEALWSAGETEARHVAEQLHERCGWNVNSTYTLLKRCIAKGAAERREPGFVCRPLVSREAVQRLETEKLLDRVFDGAADKLFTALLGSGRLTPEQLRELKKQVEALEAGEAKS